MAGAMMPRGQFVTVATAGDYGKPRAALVVQSDLLAELPSVVICPLTTTIRNDADQFRGDVPLFVEHCEAVAAEVDVKRRWHGEQGCRVSVCFGEPPVQHVTQEAACELSIF